jgi:hydrogenase maturation protease
MMTTQNLTRATEREARASAPPMVDVLVCGSIDRGDDGAPSAAMQLLEASPSDNVRIIRVGQVDVDDLLGVPAGSGVVIVDAATGIDPGVILELPLRALVGMEEAIRPRSSHALAMPEVIGLADMLRGRPLIGRVVVIGARRFTIGRPLTRRVAAALPALSRAVRHAIDQVTETILQERELHRSGGS